MNINIARDARPQVRTLLVAAAITFVLWLIPFADVLTYPFRIFVTFIHEGGHALAALLTGNSVSSLSVAADGSGLTYSTTGGFLSALFISSAGYLGATAFGALLLVLIRRTIAARIVLVGSAALIGVLTVVFGLFKPLLAGSGGNLMGVPFTLVAGALIAVGLLAVAKYSSPRVATFFVSFLAVQCVMTALLDLKTLFFLSSPFTLGEAHSDAANMKALTGVPAMFWTLAWAGIAFVILSLALRAYAVSRGKATEQQDLPFEEPLEV
ncbi:MAG: hypothetical protein QOF02_2052 [Blastocatellia bacterium]|jgi:hypothetical protein|nr:hypothetical protein [Blastocatellia bacterium]